MSYWEPNYDDDLKKERDAALFRAKLIVVAILLVLTGILLAYRCYRDHLAPKLPGRHGPGLEKQNVIR